MAAFASQNVERDYPGYVRGLNSYRRMTLPATVTAAEGYFVLTGAALRARPSASLVATIGPRDEGPISDPVKAAGVLLGGPVTCNASPGPRFKSRFSKRRRPPRRRATPSKRSRALKRRCLRGRACPRR